ncbi:MAG: tetratricopeptide repeat protein [candidate division KSB1 bacterium]|nr:tetratricopeptide repeat protein [candidate division KSB1 bacterium]
MSKHTFGYMALLMGVWFQTTVTNNYPIEFNPLILEGIEYIFHENFDKAEAIFDQVIQQHPERPGPYFFKGVVYWRRSLNVENYSKFDQAMLTWLDKAIGIADSALQKDPQDAEAFFYKGGAHGFKGTLYARRQDWLKTGYHAYHGIKNLQRALKIAPELYDVYYGTGLYHVMAGHTPGIVRLIQKILPIPSGNPKQGLQDLKIASERGRYTQIGGRSALAFAYLWFEEDYQKTIEILEPLIKQYPDCIDFGTMLANAYFYRELTTPTGEWDKLLQTIDQIEKIVRERPFDLSRWWRDKLIFMRGYAYYSTGKYELAANLLQLYTRRYPNKGDSYLTGLGELTLGKIYDLQGQRKKAKEKYTRALKQEPMGNLEQLAQHYLETPFTGEVEKYRFTGAKAELPDRP